MSNSPFELIEGQLECENAQATPTGGQAFRGVQKFSRSQIAAVNEFSGAPTPSLLSLRPHAINIALGHSNRPRPALRR